LTSNLINSICAILSKTTLSSLYKEGDTTLLMMETREKDNLSW
jgi:hypothetical protein